ncbi:cysteine-rich receptor-like protein kinase 15 isoform X2 [Magnolia sinica]|uniref:cysteine-rich receptor-like protein kinase 15 isoform X2 n=1 Tax=Magnolia sinica TaxID=86752 RepID=UPI0026587829|nr:cysteine-rich receptor-like protein kinase 15 isoform X2 [Magnolia sinica]
MRNFQSKPLDFLLHLTFFLLLLFPTLSHAAYLHSICSNRANYTANSTFGANLNQVLSVLSSNARFSTYFYDDKGDDPAIAYGLFVCRGDITTDLCSTCVNQASKEIKQKCHMTTEAFIWYDCGMLRYSDRRFRSVYNPAYNSIELLTSNVVNASDPQQFNATLNRLMKNISFVAAFDPLVQKFAIGKANSTINQTIYGLVQCTQDLTNENCNACLQDAISIIPKCCDGKIGGRILGANCILMFDVNRLYYESSAAPTAEKRRKRSMTLIIAIVATVSGLALFGSCIYFYSRAGKKLHKEKSQQSLLHGLGSPVNPKFLHASMEGHDEVHTQELPMIDLPTIQAATNDFSEGKKLGQGGFGPVYKGLLPDGTEIAVKRLSRSSGQGLEELKNEVTLIAKLQHRNLVRLLYCCIERGEKLLVYEYMPNTSLDVFLFDPIKRIELNWERRHTVVGGIARGLLYLHEDSRLKIIHRDMKASNVLLDNEMNPKISDFGMARIFSGNQSEVNTNRVVGTYGYMAPEYAMGGLFSVKSDVYSFGVLLLEIVSGKRNSSLNLPEHAQSLLTYTWRLWCDGRAMEIVDPFLVEKCPKNEVFRWIHIGLLCIQEDAADRPTMSTVVVMLGSESVNLPQPTQPGFFVARAMAGSDKSSASAIISSTNQITISTTEAR